MQGHARSGNTFQSEVRHSAAWGVRMLEGTGAGSAAAKIAPTVIGDGSPLALPKSHSRGRYTSCAGRNSNNELTYSRAVDPLTSGLGKSGPRPLDLCSGRHLGFSLIRWPTFNCYIHRRFHLALGKVTPADLPIGRRELEARLIKWRRLYL